MSWTNVARKALLEDPEFHEEFNGVSFDSLGLAQRQALKQRIREGVRSYAARVGLPLPSRIEVSHSSPGEGEQEKTRNSARQETPPNKLPS